MSKEEPEALRWSIPASEGQIPSVSTGWDLLMPMAGIVTGTRPRERQRLSDLRRAADALFWLKQMYIRQINLEIKQHLYASPEQKGCFISCLVTINKTIK